MRPRRRDRVFHQRVRAFKRIERCEQRLFGAKRHAELRHDHVCEPSGIADLIQWRHGRDDPMIMSGGVARGFRCG